MAGGGLSHCGEAMTNSLASTPSGRATASKIKCQLQTITGPKTYPVQPSKKENYGEKIPSRNNLRQSGQLGYQRLECHHARSGICTVAAGTVRVPASRQAAVRSSHGHPEHQTDLRGDRGRL